LRLYRQTNDRIGEATTLNNIGLATGDPSLCLQAFAIRKGIDDQVGLADSYYFVTSPVGGVRWNDRAYAFRLKSLRLSEKIGYAWGKEVAARAVDQMVFGTYDSLSFQYAAAETTVAVGEAEIFRLQARSVSLIRRGQVDESIRLRERVVFLCDSMRYTPGLGMALAQYADALIIGGRYKEAERAISRSRTVWREGSPTPDLLLAKMHHASGNYAEAALTLTQLTNYYDRAYRDNLRDNSLNVATGQGRILNSRFTAYEKLIDCYSRINDVTSLFLAMERFRSITALLGEGALQLETMQQPYNAAVEAIESGDTNIAPLLKEFAQTYDRSQDIHSATLGASSVFDKNLSASLAEIQNALGPDEIVLDYFLGTEHGYVLAIGRDTCMQDRLGSPVRDINSSALALHDLILRGQKMPDDTLWKGPAGFLYSSLLEPVGPVLRDGDHVIISPHGQLHGIPFAPLLDAQERPAIDRFRISIARSAGEIVRNRTKPSGATALAVVPDRASLRFTEQEVARIPQALFTSRAVLMDGQATTAEFLKRAPGADLIHIAAHGIVDRVLPLFSRIELWDGPLELHRIATSSFAARLVLISACESGLGIGMLGDLSYGHVVVSFPYAFLAAGASTVLAPLWIVEDEAAAHLIGSFYTNLEALESQDKPTRRGTYPLALALAQRQASLEHLKSHPFYWAGFQILGLVNE
jgi:CHAT domain-containing protein